MFGERLPQPGRAVTELRSPRSPGAVVAGMALLLVVTAACGAGPGATGSSTPTGSSVPTAPTPGATPILEPSVEAGPSVTPSPAPLAEIVTKSGRLAGALGTYTLDGRGSDAPWQPFDTLPALGVEGSRTLTLRFVDDVAIGDWSAVLATADDVTGTTPLGVDGGALAPDAASLLIGPLPPGRWVLAVRLFRADGRGDGLTYWAVTVR